MTNQSSDELRQEQRELERIGHLTGYQAAMLDYANQLELTGIAVGNLHEEGDDLMAVADVLKQAAAETRQGAETTKAAIDAAFTRVSDNENLTQADKDAILGDLTAAKEANAAATAAADTIDPAVPGGVVTDPENPGEVVEA